MPTRRTPPDASARRRPQIGVGGFRIGPRAKALVMEVLDSNRLTAGPMMARFEAEIAALHACRYGLMCNSGTSALQIALQAVKEVHGWDDGDEVLVPAVTFVATANVVLYNQLMPVFVDVEPDYYCIDPARIEARITPRTRAIMPVHVGGLPCDMDPILEIARRHHLRIVEDSAEAMFVTYRGRPVGSFGDIGCFSTYAAHMVTTGIGGLCTTDDADLLLLLKSIMNHGRDSLYIRIDDDLAARGDDVFRVADSRFSFVRFGHSFRATEMEAAIGIAQLEDRDTLCARRRTIAAALDDGLAPLAGEHLRLPATRAGAEHAYMFYAITITNDRVARADLIQYLEERSIETRYVLPLINQPVYRQRFGNLDSEYPVAAHLNERAFYIGCHPDMTDDDVSYVVD
ncbi:MAG: DegT/DnrJ/EryC1/StrS family aminotransferase, partial [Acidobacteriota bacterium]